VPCLNLVKAGYKFQKTPPRQVKKWFTGNGNATKWDMWNHFCTLQVGLDLRNLIPGTFNENAKDGVPKPHADLVDAFALAFAPTYLMHQNKTKAKAKPKAKRRKVASSH
jgi:Holliday junction resolvasome RuvABC endonuclease subunit